MSRENVHHRFHNEEINDVNSVDKRLYHMPINYAGGDEYCNALK